MDGDFVEDSRQAIVVRAIRHVVDANGTEVGTQAFAAILARNVARSRPRSPA